MKYVKKSESEAVRKLAVELARVLEDLKVKYQDENDDDGVTANLHSNVRRALEEAGWNIDFWIYL